MVVVRGRGSPGGGDDSGSPGGADDSGVTGGADNGGGTFSYLREKYIVTCIPIARQRLCKHISAKHTHAT
jgi:hypothetical protein